VTGYTHCLDHPSRGASPRKHRVRLEGGPPAGPLLLTRIPPSGIGYIVSPAGVLIKALRRKKPGCATVDVACSFLARFMIWCRQGNTPITRDGTLIQTHGDQWRLSLLIGHLHLNDVGLIVHRYVSPGRTVDGRGPSRKLHCACSRSAFMLQYEGRTKPEPKGRLLLRFTPRPSYKYSSSGKAIEKPVICRSGLVTNMDPNGPTQEGACLKTFTLPCQAAAGRSGCGHPRHNAP